MEGSVLTVGGPIPPNQLGVTLPHEHVIHQVEIHSGNPDNRFDDIDLMADELGAFRRAGGGAVCDVTPLGLGRDPCALREVSQRSGVTVISGVGLYQTEVLPTHLAALPEEALADGLVREIEGGTSGIPAGLIGEIASRNSESANWLNYRLTEAETRVFRAVAQAQRRTGRAIYTHASLGRPGVAQLRTLIDAGADPERVIIGHCDAQVRTNIDEDLAYYHEILREGACLGFDLFTWAELASDADRFKRIAALTQQGHADRVLLSTDTCRKSQLHRFGGRGFDALLHHILPELRHAGVPESAIRPMTVLNPARVLTCRL